MSKLMVTVTEQVADVAVTEQIIEVNEATGIGPQGIPGVVAATAPVTYNSGTQTVGINAGVANGVATLDSDGKVPTTQLPPLAVNDTFVVASQAAMLALTAQVGDIAVRTDVTKTFILTASPSSTLGNWQEILTPPGVTSITASAPLTGGTITSTGSIGIDQTALSIGTSQVSWSAITAWAASTSYTKGALVEYQGRAYRRISTGTSGSTFDPAMWQQVSPTNILATQLSGTITDAQLASGVDNQGNANKILKVGSDAVTRVQGLRAANSIGYGTVEAQYSLQIGTAPNVSSLSFNGSATNYLPSTSGTLIGTGDTGTVTSDMIANGTIVQADLNTSTYQNYIAGVQGIVKGDIAPFAITTIGSNSISPASNTWNCTAFTAPFDDTVSSVSFINITAIATITSFKIGLYSWAKNTSGTTSNRWTLLASYDPASADTTALANQALVTKTLTAVSGGTLSLTAGNRYAVGIVATFSTGTPAYGAGGTFGGYMGDCTKIDYPLFGYKGTSGNLTDSGVGYVDQPTMTASRNPLWFKLS